MNRYIDAELLLTDNTYEWFDDWGNYTSAGQAIVDAPTADVVEVVRCHNCEYHGIKERCPLLKMFPYRDDERGYCSEGKRMNKWAYLLA